LNSPGDLAPERTASAGASLSGGGATGRGPIVAAARRSAREQPDRDPRSRSRVGGSGSLQLLTLALTVLFSYIALRGVRLGEAWSTLRASNYLWLLPALAALALAMTARALRWRSLFARERRPPLSTIANAMMVGYLYNNILPARAGEVARVVVLARRSDAQPVEIVGTSMLERFLDVFGILVIFFIAQPWLPAVSWFEPAAIAALVLALAVAAAAVTLAVHGEDVLLRLARPLARLPLLTREHLERGAAELTLGLSALRDPAIAFAGLLWTVVSWVLTGALAYFVTLALHLHLPFACGILVAVAVGLAMILPAAPAAVGVFEGAALIGLKAYGLSHSVALPYAVVLHLINFLPVVAFGVVLLRYNALHTPAPSLAGARARTTRLGAELPAAQQVVPVQLQAQ